VALAEPIGDLQALEQAHWLLGELDLLHGRPAAAAVRLEPLVSWEAGYEVAVLSTLAQAYLDLGQIDKAEESIQKALLVATARQHRLFLGQALRVQAMVMTRRCRWNEARPVFQSAVSMARDMPYPYAEGRALYEYAMMLMHAGERREARARLVEALAVFAGLGAKTEVERTEAALAALDSQSEA